MKIYTKTGDMGETSLGSGTRLCKSSLRVCAYGEVDELNAFLGLCACCDMKKEFDLLKNILAQLQKDLWMLGADLAAPDKNKVGGKIVPRINGSNISRLEKFIDEMDELLPELKNFVMPGGSVLASKLHLARSVCRRAERAIVKLSAEEKVASEILAYINRLSDLLFVMARYANHIQGVKDPTLKMGF